MKTIALTYHIKDINAIATSLLGHLECKTILFRGDMGVGKTTFINALLKVMGSDDIATSPTFSIVNEYQLPKDKVFHFDFYRIESLEEAYNFGVEDYLTSNAWLFIEWPERVEGLFNDVQTVTISKTDNHIRSLKLTIDTNILTEHNAMTEPKF